MQLGLGATTYRGLAMEPNKERSIDKVARDFRNWGEQFTHKAFFDKTRRDNATEMVAHGDDYMDVAHPADDGFTSQRWNIGPGGTLDHTNPGNQDAMAQFVMNIILGGIGAGYEAVTGATLVGPLFAPAAEVVPDIARVGTMTAAEEITAGLEVGEEAGQIVYTASEGQALNAEVINNMAVIRDLAAEAEMVGYQNQEVVAGLLPRSSETGIEFFNARPIPQVADIFYDAPVYRPNPLEAFGEWIGHPAEIIEWDSHAAYRVALSREVVTEMAQPWELDELY